MAKPSPKLTPRGKAIRARAIRKLRAGEEITKKEMGHLAESFGAEKKHEKKHGKYKVSGRGDAKSFIGEEKSLIKKRRSKPKSGSARKAHNKSNKKSSGEKEAHKMSKKEKMTPFGKKGKWIKKA